MSDPAGPDSPDDGVEEFEVEPVEEPDVPEEGVVDPDDDYTEGHR